MSKNEHEELSVRAESGDSQAQTELARLFEADGRDDEAVKWLQRAVDGGDAHAKWLLGKRLLTKESAGTDHRAPALIKSAAESDGEAAHFLAVLHACGTGVPRDWSIAFDYLTHSAELGFLLARDELAFLATGEFERGQEIEARPGTWKRYREMIDLSSWIKSSPATVVSRDPRIVTVEGAAPPAMCDWFLEQAKPDQIVAAIQLRSTGEVRQSERRTNSTTAFNPFKMNMIMAVFRLRISALTGLSNGMEDIQILHYAVGQRYEPHFDFIAETQSAAVQRTDGMQRVLTFLLYLNDDYESGETCFPRISWQHKGRKGDALFFWNVDTRGQPDHKTFHEGSAPTKGEKWVLSQWIQRELRESPARYRI